MLRSLFKVNTIDIFIYLLICFSFFSCCDSKRHQLPSCSNPRYQLISSVSPSPNSSDFCPAPPKLAYVCVL